MNIKKLLKIVGLIIGPLLPLTIAIYFLFPFINEDKHQEVAKKEKEVAAYAENGTVKIGEDFETVREQAIAFQEDNRQLQQRMDSLRGVNDSLHQKLAAQAEELEERARALAEEQLSAGEGQVVAAAASADENREAFAESVKSFLSLDDENLAPILGELTDEQLVRLYREGSSIQRQKILRSLESKRAANLMTEVM